MYWTLVVGFNAVIAVCYVVITTIIIRGLIATKQLTRNQLAVATASIFASCATHHAEHALHLAFSGHRGAEIYTVRHVMGSTHAVVVDLIGVCVAIWYLAVRHQYKTLLQGPAMFDDAVRTATEAGLRKAACTDQLTGVANRAAYHIHAQAAASDEGTATVVYLDLVGFKQVNDTCGHDVGDQVLTAVATRLHDDLAEQEHLFRIGGDEFVLILQSDAPRTEVDVRGRFSALLAPTVDLGDHSFAVGASLGVACGPAATMEHLVRKADLDMYAHKVDQRRSAVPSPRPPFEAQQTQQA